MIKKIIFYIFIFQAIFNVAISSDEEQILNETPIAQEKDLYLGKR